MSASTIRPGKIAKWGNSAAVRLGVDALERANLSVDDPVDVIAGDDGIIIRRRQPRVTMADLLARFDPKTHRHDPILDVAPVGSETAE